MKNIDVSDEQIDFAIRNTFLTLKSPYLNIGDIFQLTGFNKQLTCKVINILKRNSLYTDIYFYIIS